MLIDTHTHLFLPEFAHDLDQVMERTVKNGIKTCLCPNIDSSTTPALLALTDKYPGVCYPMMGLHPNSVTENYPRELEMVRSWLSRRKFHAIGETGIDLYRSRSKEKEQTEAFREQAILSAQTGLPLVIHVRNSFREVMAVLRELKGLQIRGVFHSFTGTPGEARQIIEMGFMIGINGIVTFRNSGLDRVVEKTDPQHILLETDAPYLAPHPHRGKRNESGYLIHTAEKVAAIYGLSLEEIARITTVNAKKIFRIDEE